VYVGYKNGLFEGTSRVFSYHANFTATSGNFSAQFGAHYLQLKRQPEDLMLHGAAASGTALFSLPLSKRHSNGVPVVALDLYFGGVPTAAVSGPENFLSVPLVLGVGLSLAPAGWITVTPWFEAAPSINLDTTISQLDFTVTVMERLDELEVDPETQELTLLTDEDIGRVLGNSVDLRFSTHVATRAGLLATMHVGRKWDLNAGATLTSFGTAFAGTLIGHVGVGLSFHWDDVVPAVLPAKTRLRGETCEDIEQRFMVCPNYRAPVPAIAVPNPGDAIPQASPDRVAPPRTPAPRGPKAQPAPPGDPTRAPAPPPNSPAPAPDEPADDPLPPPLPAAPVFPPAANP
jgi:hypothetical protein